MEISPMNSGLVALLLVAVIAAVIFSLNKGKSSGAPSPTPPPNPDPIFGLPPAPSPVPAPPPPPRVFTVTIYGDSAKAGGYGIPPDPTLHFISPLPVEMINAVGPVRVAINAICGRSLKGLLAGGPIAPGVPGIGEPGATTATLEEFLKTDTSDYFCLAPGHVDCLFTTETAEEFLNDVKQALALAAASAVAGSKKPILHGFNRFAPTDLMTPDRLARRDQFDAALAAFALGNDVPFIDVGSVPFNGLSDLMVDQVHPTVEYHQRIAAFIASRLKEITGAA